jgi:hypothetical protein
LSKRVFVTNSSGFWPDFSECRVFSAGMKIVVEKILKIPFGNVFESFLTRFYELSIFKAFGVILLHFEMD